MAKKIASEIGCTKQEAQELIDDYFRKAHGLKDWIDNCKRQISTHGWIKSAFGRTRRVPEVFSPSMGVKYHALNSAFNFVVQSAASDMNLLIFSRLMRTLNESGWIQDDLVLPWNIVHDSMIFEIREDYIVELKCMITSLFDALCKEKYPHMPVPIQLDFEVGDDWGHLNDKADS